MLLQTFKNFPDFELLDTGGGFRLERWGRAILQRPDPQIIWERGLLDVEWNKAWAVYKSAADDNRAVPRTGAAATGIGGKWEIKKPVPSPWIINYHHPLLTSSIKGEEQDTVKFLLKLSPFKHTGLFAEQAAQWEWMREKISNSKSQIPNKTQKSNLKILNLFAYTGGATMVLAKAGCHVTHVDASKPAITWANENHKLNNLQADSVRWILDDCVKFVKRELKRDARYNGIIMDPPAFGHSPTGKTWKFNDDLPGLLSDCVRLLSDDAKFLIINGYATNSSALALNNLLEDAMKGKDESASRRIEFGELCLKHPIGNSISNGARKNSRMISTGIFARWG